MLRAQIKRRAAPFIGPFLHRLHDAANELAGDRNELQQEVVQSPAARSHSATGPGTTLNRGCGSGTRIFWLAL